MSIFVVTRETNEWANSVALKSEERVKNDQILVVIDQDKKQGGLADFFNQKTIFL